MRRKKVILIVCGPPSCGKTTIARILSERLGISLTRTDELKGSRYRKLAEIIRKADTGIFEGTFYSKGHWELVLPALKGKKFYIVVVKCSPRVALERNRKREGGIPERALLMIHRSYSPPPVPHFVVDTDGMDPEEAAGRIIQFLLNGNN